MSGELVKIGAKSGAIAAWSIIIRVLAGKKLPIKIIQQILSEILSDIIGDLLKDGGDEAVTAYEDIPNTATLYQDHGVVTLLPDAIGVRTEIFPLAADGKYFGRNGTPDYYGLNRFESCPGGYMWRHQPWNANSTFIRFDSPGQLCMPPTSIKPSQFLVYPNPGVDVVVIQIKKKG